MSELSIYICPNILIQMFKVDIFVNSYFQQLYLRSVIYEKVPYCGTNIVGPDQTPRIMFTISFAHEHLKHVCCSLRSINQNYNRKSVKSSRSRMTLFVLQ